MTDLRTASSPRSRGVGLTFIAVFVLSSTLLLAYNKGWLTEPASETSEVAYAAPAPSQETDRPPTPNQTRELVASLDHDFNAADLNGYLGKFTPLHSHNQEMLRQRLGPAISAGNLHRESAVVKLRQVGNRTIALVSSETWDPKGRAAGRSKATEFIVCHRVDGQTRALFSIEVDERNLDLLAELGQPGLFNCLACNYRIQSNEDWLLVPHSQLRAGCLESISFYSLYHNLSIDLSVHIDLEKVASPPQAVLAKLTQGMQATQPEAWLPPAYGNGRMTPPVGLSGSQVDVSHADGQHSLLRLAVYGPIRYLLAVRGPEATLNLQEQAIQAVLTTFEVIDPIFSPGHVPGPDRPTHLVGKLSGREFIGDMVQFSGPEGWLASRTADWSQFHITYQRPDGSGYVKVRGMPPPIGLDVWTQEAANLVISASLEGVEQLIVEDQGWQTGSSQNMGDWPGIRRLELVAKGEGQDQHSLIRLAMAPNILVLFEANGENPDFAAEVEGVFASLRQR